MEMARDLLKDGVTVGELITDGDSQSFRGMPKVMQEKAGQRVKHEKCLVHLSRNVRNKVSSKTWSPTMFPGKNANQRKMVQHRFAVDLPARLNAEHAQALLKFGMRTRLRVE